MIQERRKKTKEVRKKIYQIGQQVREVHPSQIQTKMEVLGYLVAVATIDLETLKEVSLWD